MKRRSFFSLLTGVLGGSTVFPALCVVREVGEAPCTPPEAGRGMTNADLDRIYRELVEASNKTDPRFPKFHVGQDGTLRPIYWL